jgi:ABC-2 type transport system permease protein
MVIARRDFTAIIFSKAFFFFLLGPLFPVGIGVMAGGLGQQVRSDMDRPVIGTVLSEDERQKLNLARTELSKNLGTNAFPELVAVETDDADVPPMELLKQSDQSFTLIMTGTLEKPLLTGSKADVDKWTGKIALLAATALSSPAPVSVERQDVASSASAEKRSRLLTAQAGQVILILLTMILAGMVLSNLVEEKANKIIEILAAAIPMDAIFLGKLFAMLAMAWVGIAFWAFLGLIIFFAASAGMPSLPPPAVGWPAFIALLMIYFSMAYLLIGSLFLGIGAMASTVREVQTLSMPVTMGQLLVFFLATYAVTKLGEPIEWAAVLFPFSSPFAMIARAAQMDNLWQHGLAIAWQAMFTVLIIRLGAALFRRNVMQSGPRKSVLARMRG